MDAGSYYLAAFEDLNQNMHPDPGEPAGVYGAPDRVTATDSAVAGATTRPKLGMIHQAHYFRHPSLAAKMASTIDQLSGGRLIHFMDCGYQGREYVNYGLPWKDDVADRAADLDEAIDLITTLWTTSGPVTYAGTMWQVDNAISEPKPLQQPHPPLWFGEVNPVVLDLCASRGDGWNSTPVSVEEMGRRIGLLTEACERHGRDANGIEKSLETQILIAPDLESLRQKLRSLIELGGTQNHLPPQIAPFVHSYATDENTQRFIDGDWDELPEPMASDWLIGTPEMIRDRIAAYRAEGISHFMLWFMDAPDPSGMELFASEFLSDSTT